MSLFRYFRQLLFEMRRLNDNLERLPHKMEKAMSEVADRLRADVERQTTVIASVQTLISGLLDQIKAKTDDPEVLTLLDQFEANNTALANAVTTGTSAAAPAPGGAATPIPQAPQTAAQTAAADQAAAQAQ